MPNPRVNSLYRAASRLRYYRSVFRSPAFMPLPSAITMRKSISSILSRTSQICFALAVVFAVMPTASAQTFTSLVNFDKTHGEEPIAAVQQSTDGNFYGVTVAGGTYNSDCAGTCGTAFQMTPAGTLTTLYDFCQQADCADGFEPLAGLMLASDGNLYGTTAQGGLAVSNAGTIFRIAPNGSLSPNFYNLAAPSLPSTTLVPYIDGNLYGTTLLGGADGLGSTFKISTSGAFHNLSSFDEVNGESPSSLVLARDGNFYGTTTAGGFGNGCNRTGCGTFFRLTPTGAITVLYNFCSGKCRDGSAPTSLIQASNGYLYGVTTGGGHSLADGTLFQLSLDGGLTTLYRFCSQSNCTDGLAPQSLIEGSDGNLYGATAGGGDLNCNPGPGAGCGTIFELAHTGAFSTLHTFESADGSYPYGLSQGTNGKFYGVTSNGGSNSACDLGCGTIYSFDAGLAPFTSFVFPAGKPGQTIGLLGQGFTGTSAVSFNGTPANFTVVSDTFLQATVPAGVKSGYVSVTTPGGTLRSNVAFVVIP
ncbi:MAG: choice-of-anchor tandem repeat GloVer-containing protein [Terriglobales bacterium]